MLLPHAAAAADVEVQAFEACADIVEDGGRLACFDAAAARARDAAAGSAPAAEPAAVDAARATPQPPPAASPPVTPEPRAGSAETAGTADVPDGPETAAPGRVPEPKAAERPPREFSATVSRVSANARGEHRVHLANGQVWRQDFASKYFPVEAGDRVTIRKRRFGGHRLVTPSGKGYNVSLLQ